MILTGPNMGGKSTYLRQVALLCLLAQTGSFVPAREAKVGLIDRLYARVGASDNIARGQSTFMVEMQETAHILSGATSQSLVVLDEIGRGTATFDGLSIAWAVAEYLATNPRARPKTLFATHYHELTDLADAFAGVVNAHVAAREWKDDIIFLHKILPGRSDRSYGIQVARLAGLPASVIARARDILGSLEQDELTRGGKPSLSGARAGAAAAARAVPGRVTPADEKLRERIREIDINRTTPLDALQILEDLKKDDRRMKVVHGSTEARKHRSLLLSALLCFCVSVLLCMVLAARRADAVGRHHARGPQLSQQSRSAHRHRRDLAARSSARLRQPARARRSAARRRRPGDRAGNSPIRSPTSSTSARACGFTTATS